MTMMSTALCIFALAPFVAAPADVATEPVTGFRLVAEFPVSPFGGIPFAFDLDGDGQSELLWLQSPGIFHSRVFDVPPWLGKLTEQERAHFCLTATDMTGKLLWRVGAPWPGDRPFVTHCAERGLDCADIDGDGVPEVVCVRRNELLVIDGKSGAIEKRATMTADNGQIVRLAHTGASVRDWTILVQNSESAYPPHEYGNPAWFFSSNLELLRTVDYLGSGHAPQVYDVDGDGLHEFLIGYNLVNHALDTVWTFQPVSREEWDAAEMHVDYASLGEFDGRLCAAMAASDMTYLLDAESGELLWKRKGTHPQYCQTGRFQPDSDGTQVLVFNKRADLQLYDPKGNELWRMTPPLNFPLGQAEACRHQAFHTFDPIALVRAGGRNRTDLIVFVDAGCPYVVDGAGRRVLEFPYTQNAAQDWGDVPGRPDDYGYGYYARTANLDTDSTLEILINDRRYAWLYECERDYAAGPAPRSDGSVLNADLESYTDGVVQVLNAGVRWLGDPFSNLNQGTVEVTRGSAYAGSRCARVATESPEQIGRVRFQPRFNAPQFDEDMIGELVFRSTANAGTDLSDLVVWSATSSDGQPAAITILANGAAESGTYHLDVVHGGPAQSARTDRVFTDLKQNEWVRIIVRQDMGQREVSLWVGLPESEVYVGAYPDLDASDDIHAIEVGDTSTKEQQGSGYWDDIRIGKALGPSAPMAAPESALRDLRNEPPRSDTPIHVGREKQLFVDDAVIESMNNISRNVHAAVKHPKNPLLLPATPWELDGIWFVPYDVIREKADGPFRLWYGSYRKSANKLTYTCVAESQDGIAWTRPTLGLFEFNGSTENNIVWQGRAVKPNFDPRDPDPARRYKAMTRSNAFTPLFSPDGLHWTEAAAPVISQAYDATSFHWDPVGKKWIASCKIFRDGKRARGYAESPDYVHWSDTYFMLSADERDHPQDETYAMRIFRYESVYIGLLKIYHVATDRCDLQLAFSRNAKQWQRPFRTPFLTNSEEKGAYDYGNLDEAGEPIPTGDELRFYYAGRSVLHNEAPTDTNGSLCAATLRLDGFVSLDADGEGSFTTKPLVLEGRSLYVNADAKAGAIHVEMLDPSGQPISEYSASTPIIDDAVRIPVRWQETDTRLDLPRDPVRLRFTLANAKLYAFWVE